MSFNPRTRMGCDITASGSQNKQPGFNPRTRMGCDQKLGFKRGSILVSIHAPAWGATNNVGRSGSP